MAVVSLAFVIAKVPLKRNRIIFIGITLAFTAYILRLFPITFGVHTILLIGLLFIILIQLFEIPVSVSLLSSTIAFTILIIIESLCISTLVYISGITLENLMEDTYIRILFSIPHVLLISILALVIYKIRIEREIK